MGRYVLTGYRPSKASYGALVTSSTFIHNEGCNIYTHLIGAVLLPFFAAQFPRAISEKIHFPDVSGTEYAMFQIFFLCAECCLVFSTIYHLVEPHSRCLKQLWHRMDLLGIIAVTIGTFIPGLHYIYCDSGLRRLHWGVVSDPSSEPLRTYLVRCVLDLSSVICRIARY